MASGTGIYFAAKLLNQIFIGAAYSFGAILDLRLWNAGLTNAGTGGATEVSGSGYATFAMTGSTYFSSTATNSDSNTTLIPLGAATGAWTQANTLGIHEHGNNNLLLFGDLAAPKTLGAGDTIQFAIGALVINQT